MKNSSKKLGEKIKLSVIIPCYNEAANLRRGVLGEVYRYLSRQKYSWEVVVSDDGSTDNGLTLAREFSQKHPRFKVLANKHGGKPWAVWQGIEAARGEIILFADMDQSTPIKELGKLLPWFKKGFDVVIGSRGMVRKDAPLMRKIMALTFLTSRRLLILRNIVDTQCGFKAMKRRVAGKIFPKLQFFQERNKNVKGWRVSAFDVEMLFIAQKLNYKIKEVRVDWKDRDITQEKEKDFLKESWAMAKEIARVKFNDLRGRYAQE